MNHYADSRIDPLDETMSLQAQQELDTYA